MWRSKEERKVNIREKPISCLTGSAGEKAERAGGNIQVSQGKSLVKEQEQCPRGRTNLY